MYSWRWHDVNFISAALTRYVCAYGTRVYIVGSPVEGRINP